MLHGCISRRKFAAKAKHKVKCFVLENSFSDDTTPYLYEFKNSELPGITVRAVEIDSSSGLESSFIAQPQWVENVSCIFFVKDKLSSACISSRIVRLFAEYTEDTKSKIPTQQMRVAIEVYDLPLPPCAVTIPCEHIAGLEIVR